jgi:O-antigen/teichoic acid export membrane protein
MFRQYKRDAQDNGGYKMANSRTENVARNAWFALVTEILNILLSFVSRTVFIYILGVEYLGINGLFTNVLLLLSFAELGIGNAIIYSMYKPLAIDDKEKIKSLMALYAKAYKLIGTFVFVAGLLVIPFMDYIIKDAPNIKENLNLIYILFLANTTFSYFFVYKKSIIIADQKNYIVALYQQAFHIIQVLAQIIFLLLTHEYILFLIIQIVCTLLNNIITAKKADSMYPYLKEGNPKPLDKEERKSIFANVRALFLYKFGSVILNGTDNIIISALIGVVAVGLCSNYLLVISALQAISGQVMNAFTASVGNLNAIGDTDDKERVFKRIFFVSAWMFGFFAVGLYMFLNPFINLWLGKEFILPQGVIFAIVLHFYINAVHFTAYTYRTTMGLFVQGRLAPLAAAIINIILSLWLGKTIGLMGIFLATSVARFFTTGIVDPVLVYRVGFNKNPIHYYKRYFLFTSIFIGLYFVLDFIISWVKIGGFIGFFVQVGIVTLLFNGILVLIFWKTEDFRDIKMTFTKIIRKKLSHCSSNN